VCVPQTSNHLQLGLLALTAVIMQEHATVYFNRNVMMFTMNWLPPWSGLAYPDEGGNKFTWNLYGNHPVVFITKQTTTIQSNATQDYFNSLSYTCYVCYMFRLVLGPSPGMAIQQPNDGRCNNNLTGPFCTVTTFIMLKYKIYNIKYKT
jgi:hypothetical protein